VDSLGVLEYAFAACVVTLAYAVRGTTGFGGQAVAVPLLALVLPLQLVLSSIVVLTVLSSIGHWMRDWSKIAWSEIRRLLPFSVIGVLAGLFLLERVDFQVLLKAFGVFVILYGCFALATASRPVRLPERFLYPAGVVLSVLAGALGATFGAAAGPLYVIYLDSRRLQRDVFRVTITTILTVQGMLRIGGYARLGFFDYTTVILVAAGLPLMLLGSSAGNWLAGRLDQRWFSLGISLLLMVSGAALLFK
jgi:uncharacterized membrane protein YfcA